MLIEVFNCAKHQKRSKMFYEECFTLKQTHSNILKKKRDLMLDLDIKNVNLYEHFLHAVIGISSQNVNLYANGFQVLPHAMAISSQSFYNFASKT